MKKIQLGKRSPLIISTSGQPVLSDQAAQVLARILLPSFVSDPELAHPHALADLPVAGPSRSLPGWDQAGNT
jgi:hypothetical protein